MSVQLAIRKVNKAILFRWALVLAWMGLIFFLSSRSKLPEASDALAGLQAIAGHFTVYAVLAALVAFALAESGLSLQRRLTFAFIFAVCYGVTDEFHQSFVPGRDADALDLLVDAIGAVTALAVYVWLERRRLRQKFNSMPGPAD
jgi:VanZ family protein